MKKTYNKPQAELMTLSKEDIMNASQGADVTGIGISDGIENGYRDIISWK